MNRILINPEESIVDGYICLTDDRAAHIYNVLRATPGKQLRIGLLNGPHGTGEVEKSSPERVVLKCTFEESTPLRPAVDLLLAIPRPKVLKRLWAQLAALGVGRIFLTNAKKVKRYYFDSHVMEPEFYNARLIEGLQQAGDTLLPEVRIVKQLKPFLENDLDLFFPKPVIRLIADPAGGTSEIQQSKNRLLLAVGPEGGWTPYELELFVSYGFRMIGMGKRILRTDTACIALLSRFTLDCGA
jgi:RsmE family RNA methyltransferase